MDRKALFGRAVGVLRENDCGAYTVSAKSLYPVQWNWGSCLTALGQAHVSAPRAWTEIETLFARQREGGMAPHIVFHVHDDGYFPGAAVRRTKRGETETSGITQPAFAGFAEYYDPSNGSAGGGTCFTLTAAMVLEFLQYGMEED